MNEIDLNSPDIVLLEQYHTAETFEAAEGVSHFYFSKVLVPTDEGMLPCQFVWFGPRPGLRGFVEDATYVAQMEEKPLFHAALAPPYIFIVDKGCTRIFMNLVMAVNNDTSFDLFKFFYNPEHCAVFKDDLIKVV